MGRPEHEVGIDCDFEIVWTTVTDELYAVFLNEAAAAVLYVTFCEICWKARSPAGQFLQRHNKRRFPDDGCSQSVRLVCHGWRRLAVDVKWVSRAALPL
jgi:hypothetical protein